MRENIREKMREKPPRGKRPEWIAFVLFAALYCVVSVFHEPWFDEAQAWQIAKCAGFRDIFLEIPHYEGHPPLWHLLLSVPAKLGVPFEAGLKSVGGIIAAANAYWLLFRSSLPRVVRLLLPFNYFVFYQYGVIVRPYGLLLLALLLLSEQFSQRNEKPWRFALLLMLLCLISALGIVLAGGLALCRVWELWREKGARRFFAELASDKRTLALGALLALALAMIAEIMPREDTLGISFHGNTPLWLCIVCALLTFPLECCLSTVGWFGVEQLSMQTMDITLPALLMYSLPALSLWFVLVCIGSRRTLPYLLVPYALFSLFAAVVYFSTHHLGVVMLLLIFWIDMVNRQDDRLALGKALMRRVCKSARETAIVRLAFAIICGSYLAVPAYWCGMAAYLDVRYSYCYARDMAAWLTEHGFDQSKLLCSWYADGKGQPLSEGREDYISTYVPNSSIPLICYFPHNICINLNLGRDDEAYVHHKVPDYRRSREMVREIAEFGLPDVIVGYVNMRNMYGESPAYKPYVLAAEFPAGFIWKSFFYPYRIQLRVRADLMEQHGLQELEREPETGKLKDKLVITDEMREAVRNGADPEEVLKPYLDALFGEADGQAK